VTTAARTWRTFRRKPTALVGLGVVTAFVLAGLLAPWVAPYGLEQSTMTFRGSPSPDHWLGTDVVGKDTFSQLLFGIRTSLQASVVAVVLAVVGGTALGLVSGYLGGWVDRLLMRGVDAVLSFPGLLMAMVVVGLLGRSVLNAMIGLSVAFMPLFARLVRGQVLAVREEAYVAAARIVGCSGWRIVRRHILPNVLPSLVVQASMALGFALLAEGALAYLGLTVDPPETSLGAMLRQGFEVVHSTPRLIIVPGVAITLLTLAFNAIADGLRDSLARVDVLRSDRPAAADERAGAPT
jgi:peptide/nickel transport system permease protein